MATQYDFICDQGALFQKSMTWIGANRVPIAMPSWTAKMQVKDSTDALIIELSTTNGRITLGASDGTIVLALTGADTAALDPGAYEYDLKLVSPDGPLRLIEGAFTVTDQVTV